MKSLEAGARKLETKAGHAFSDGKWQADSMASQGPCKTLSQYPEIGGACNIDPAWKEGIQSTNVAAAAQAVQSSGPKWQRNFVAGVTGRTPATMGGRR